MSKHLWMPLDIDAYLGDTTHLSRSQHGAYLLLIMRYWKDRCLPADERLIASYAHMTAEEWEADRPILAAFFEDGWRHRRIDAELAKADEITNKRRTAAQQRHSTSNANAEQMDSNSSYTRVPPKPRTNPSSLRSDGSASAKPTPRSELEAVLDTEHAKAVVEHRQRLRKPLTARAAQLLATTLGAFRDPNAAADTMIERGWQTIKPGWGEDHPSRAGPPGKPKTAADFLLSETMDRVNGHDGPQTSSWPDAGEFPGVAVSGATRRLGIPDRH
jgi:uncharacterized protein YdaU (DUF1376 family)